MWRPHKPHTGRCKPQPEELPQETVSSIFVVDDGPEDYSTFCMGEGGGAFVTCHVAPRHSRLCVNVSVKGFEDASANFSLRTLASRTRKHTASVARIRRTTPPSRAPMLPKHVWPHGRTGQAVRTPAPPPRRPRLQLLRRPRHAVSGLQ